MFTKINAAIMAPFHPLFVSFAAEVPQINTHAVLIHPITVVSPLSIANKYNICKESERRINKDSPKIINQKVVWYGMEISVIVEEVF